MIEIVPNKKWCHLPPHTIIVLYLKLMVHINHLHLHDRVIYLLPQYFYIGSEWSQVRACPPSGHVHRVQE